MKMLPNDIAVLENDEWISSWIEQSGRLDHDEYLLPRILELIGPGDYVVDCGAFVGDHSVAYRKAVGPTGFVWAFEPNPEAAQCLQHNMRKYGNVSVKQCGVGHKSETVGLITGPNAGASHLVAGQGIDIVALDDLQLQRVNLIKMDVEGFELQALKGARQLLHNFHPKLVLEINRGALMQNGADFLQIDSFLRGLGYKLKMTLPGNIDLSSEPQYDAFYV